jgi:hypothetical protein
MSEGIDVKKRVVTKAASFSAWFLKENLKPRR